MHPVFFGSAITGAGVAELTAGLTRFLPATHGDAAGPASGTVFKVERGPAGEKIAYVRMFSGALRVRDRLPPLADQKITAISVFERGPAVPREQVRAGQIGKLWGLRDIQIGDTLGVPPAGRPRHRFAPPTLETVVTPRRPADKGALHTALDPARRAGSADRPAPRRRPRRTAALALRRGAEGGHPGHAGQRVRR